MDRSHRLRRGQLAATLTILLAAGILFWGARGAEGERTQARGAPPDGTPGRADPVPEQRPPSVSPASEGASVIVLCDRGRDAVAFVSRVGEGEMLTVRAELTQGRAELRVPRTWLDSERNVRLTAGVAGPGIVKTTVDVEVGEGGGVEVPIDPPSGLTLGGRVLGPCGRPLPGIQIVARTAHIPRGKNLLDFETGERLLSAEEFHESRTLTRDDGSFEVGGLANRRYCLAIANADWILGTRSRPWMTPPMTDLSLTPSRTYQLDLTVRDAATGEGVPVSSTRIQLDADGGSCGVSGRCRDGKGTVCWAPRGAAMRDESGCVLTTRTTALGYEPKEAAVRFAPGSRVATCVVDLTPVPMGRIVFRIDARDEAAARGRFWARMSRAGNRTGHSVRLNKGPTPGVYECSAPAGVTSVQVWPRNAISVRNLEWSRTLEVPEGGVVSTVVSIPAFGSLLLDRETPVTVMMKFHIDGRWITTFIKKSRERIAAVPVGDWTYTAHRDGVEFMRGVIRVCEGAETRLTLR